MKVPFFIEKQINKILKPQLTTVLKIYVDGKLKSKQFGKSLNANFMQYLYGFITSGSTGGADFPASQAPYTAANQFRAISGAFPFALTVINIASGSVAICNANGALNDDTLGIVVGSGTATVQSDDWKLDTQILNGGAVGQINYGNSVSPDAPHIVGNTSSFILRRTFNNTSGGTLTVSEVGIYAVRGTSNSVCFYRDKITPVSVLDTQTLEVELTFSVTA